MNKPTITELEETIKTLKSLYAFGAGDLGGHRDNGITPSQLAKISAAGRVLSDILEDRKLNAQLRASLRRVPNLGGSTRGYDD